MAPDWYDTAQMCRNGHVVNDSVKSFPKGNAPHCDMCGAPTITQCDSCKQPIRGRYHMDGVWAPGSYTPPAFCSKCGATFPWTESKLQTARDFVAELKELKPKERELLNQSIEELVANTPRTEIAALRVKKLLKKVSAEARPVLQGILVKILTEAVRQEVGL